MAGQSKKPRQQDLFLSALLSQPTIAMAAKTAGISEATAGRWLKDPAFQARYTEAKQQAFGEALSSLQQSMLAAVATLRSVMLSEATRASTKVQAASKLLELGLRAHELYEMEARLQALEQRMQSTP
jgi:hypothetical protein